MWTNIAKTRSHWATAARKAVSNLYGLSASDGTPDQIKAKVEDLIANHKFMATIQDNPRGQPAIAYFNSPPLWKFLQDVLIQYPRSIARHPAVGPEYFQRLRPCTIFLACTVLQCALQAYATTGVQLSPPPMFETGEYAPLHRFMEATWKKVFRNFPDDRYKQDLTLIMRQLHENRQNFFLYAFKSTSAGVFAQQDDDACITGAGTGEEFGDSVDDLRGLLPVGVALSDLNQRE